jgi:hypothetical protein
MRRISSPLRFVYHVDLRNLQKEKQPSRGADPEIDINITASRTGGCEISLSGIGSFRLGGSKIGESRIGDSRSIEWRIKAARPTVLC